jgi:signal transduction histidine kinase
LKAGPQFFSLITGRDFDLCNAHYLYSMKIRSKLAWILALLLIVGISTVCSYSIIYIKNYFNKKGIKELQKNTRSLALAVSAIPPDPRFRQYINEIAKTSAYNLALFDSSGALIYAYPDGKKIESRLSADKIDTLKTHGQLPGPPAQNMHQKMFVNYSYLPQSINNVRYIRVSQLKSRVLAPVKKIRWIIYYGIFASVVLAVIVSIWVARYLTKPITQIKDAAQNIAAGDVNQQIDVNRQDEFGTLADSLNKMAAKLREDTDQIKRYAEHQRQFFADITHEIRNPLHTISASLEMLELDGLSDEKRQKYYKNAGEQVQRISRLFKDLKTLQQYDSDDHFIEERTFNLAKISRHMQEWYGEKICHKGLRLFVDIQACQAMGDPDKIEQVIDNLISNAIKYTGEGSVALHYFKKGKKITVEVSDTGIGISEEHLDQLFDRFYRTDKARSREKGGTGLGLAVVRSILQAHGTDINVESKPGRGTTFRFQLPAA